LNDRKKLITAYLDKYFKELDEPRIEALVGSDGAGNPLFLKIALSELRVFGVHNDLSAVIKGSFGDTPVKAFGAVLARMENDPAYSGVAPEVLLPHVLGWLAHSRYGLAVEELSDLLIREGLTNDPETANDAVYLVLRQLRPYFAKRDGRVDFFYESFKIAATERYTGDYPNARSAAEWHKSLAEYFETLPLEHRHRLMEQAWQYANAGMGEALNTLLCDYEFLDIRLRLFDIDALLGDMSCIHFDSANLDDNGLSLLKLIEGSLTLSVSILAADKGQLAAHLWARLADFEDEPIRRLLDQAVSVKRARREAWFRPLKACLPKPGGALVRTFMGNPGSGTAFAQGQDELVFSERSLGKIVRMNAITGKTIQVLPSSTSGKLIYQPEFHRILTYEHASLYLIDCIDGSRQGFLHTMPTIIANEFFAVKNVLVATCFGNKDIFIFNISEKKLVKIISGYSGSRGKVLTSDGKYLITGFDDNSVRVWDTSSGECVQVLRAHSSVPDNIIIDENSDRLYTYCKEDHTFCWDMRSWHLLYRIPVDIESGSVIAHNSRFLANPTYGGIDLYNLETGEMIKQFTFIGASCCIFNHDDSLLIVGSERGGICIYNITEMKECGGFAGHPQGVVILCLSTDEQFLISKANDFSIRVWDMKFTTAYKDAEDIYFGMKTLGDGNQLLALKNNIYAETEKIWEVKKSEVMLFDMLTAQCVNSYPTMSGAGANISICGEQDLFALSYVDIVDLYKLSTGENVKRVQYNNGLNSEENQRFIGEFYFTENMNQMIGVGYSEQHGYHILIVDIEKEEIANRFPINTSSVEFSVLTENGAKAVIASDILSNRKVQFVDTESGKTSSVLEENPSINAIGFNKNKTKIIKRAYENSLMIYDCRNGKRLYSIKVMPYPFSQDIAQISLSKKNNFLLGYVNSSSIIGVYATDICTGEPFTRFLGEQTIFDMACSDDNSSIALISQSMLSFLRLENFDDAILDLHASASTDELANLQRFKEIWDSDDIEIKTDDIPAQTENAKGGLFSGLFRGKKNHV
jgi:WD40 repeat protein